MKKMIALYLVMVLAAFALSFWAWPLLPAQMAVHFDLNGQANGWAPRWVGAFVMPAGIILIPALLLGLLRFDPRREHVQRSMPGITCIMLILPAFLLFSHAAMLWSVTQHVRFPGNLTMLGLGLLFAAFGLIMPKLKSNFFAGIRTPWTLSSEANWHRTHRFAGFSFVAGGVAASLTALWPASAFSFGLGLAAIMLGSLSPIVYSWWIRNDDTGTQSDEQPMAL